VNNIDDPCEDWDEDEEHANPVPDWEGKIRLAVIRRASNNRPGFVPWYRRMPDEVQRELDTLRQEWRDGSTGLQKRAMARAIVAELRDRGLPVCGVQGVEHWLDASNH
jgi:hypothetical protein